MSMITEESKIFKDLKPAQQAVVLIHNHFVNDFKKSLLIAQQQISVLTDKGYSSAHEILEDAKVAFAGGIIKETLATMPVEQRRHWADLIWAQVVGD